MTTICDKRLINIHELFENFFKEKKIKIAQVQIAIIRVLTGIFACSFLHHGP